MSREQWRPTVSRWLGPPAPGDHASRVINGIILLVILINVGALVVETLPGWTDRYGRIFFWVEWGSVIVFSVEYVLRLWSVVERKGYERPWSGRLRFALRPMMLIDLLAVLPAYLPLLGLDLRVLRVLRLMRVFRVLKVARYSQALQVMGEVLEKKREQLLITLSGLAILLLIASCLMYYAEHDHQPEKFSSIPATMWWAVATVTTVGYGDVYPITPIGRLIASVIAILGIGLFALPAGIIASGFSEHEKVQKHKADNTP